jgi:hypothetical protein
MHTCIYIYLVWRSAMHIHPPSGREQRRR